MNIREVANALNEIRANMSNPEAMAVASITPTEVVFENGVAYSIKTKQRVR